MKTDKNIWVAFLLNLLFSMAELIGGVLTGSVAIISDSLHDLSDAGAIAVSAILETKSKGAPDKNYTYGYGRLSVIGGAINGVILLAGSVVVACGAVMRLLNPSPVHYDGMIMMAVFGVIVNSLAAYATHSSHSMNEKTVNLHMLEDVLGWIVVLVGAVIMRYTNWWFIDPLMSMGVAVFIFLQALRAMGNILFVLLEKVPNNLDPEDIQRKIGAINGVLDVHHVHIWSLNGSTNLATMHIITDADEAIIKEKIRQLCRQNGIRHITIETESASEKCCGHHCDIHAEQHVHCQHHHHQHRHG